jgi:hypothetical protein
LDNIHDKHGLGEVAEIKKDAVYLYWTNEKRTRHNLQKLGLTNTPKNPTAIIKPKGHGDKFGKSINMHFESEMPKASLMYVGAKVCISMDMPGLGLCHKVLVVFRRFVGIQPL